ncbi:hypothetical protein [Roseibium sp. RKSG952]|uniref:hypothetical protein n=1 Tax=Roseibium sp. RKSG952 TaxID=2529384 RepID=UPI0012BBDDC8|nr:hypothetical protein [Roseibium sp. RKSG952]MTH96423.1 hypothetical protein [Roseibium sp. RKSG952]
MKQLFLLLGVSALLAGCAKGPDAIAPTPIPIAAYSSDSCKSLANQLTSERSTLASLESQQRSAQTGDAVGVFLIGVPLSSVSGGDKEGELSVAKGKVQAMELAMHSKKCPTA